MIVGVVLSRQGKPIGQPLAGLGAGVGLLVVILMQFGVFDHVVKNETMFQADSDNASKRLGRYLAEKYPDARIVIIKPYDLINKKEVRDGMISGITEELEGKMTVVNVVDPPLPQLVRTEYEKRMARNGEEANVPDLNDWFTAAMFDEVLATHAVDCDIVVSLAGLPEDSRNLKFWQRPDRPKLALGFSMTRVPFRRFVSGDIVAAVSYRLKTPLPADLPETDDEVVKEFNYRYYLITPDNAAKIRTKQPRLFVKPPRRRP